MLTKDEYGQVHNSPETYAHIAQDIQRFSAKHDGYLPLIFEWVDERMSRFVVLLYLAFNPAAPSQRYLYVGLERKGFYGFPMDSYLHPGYVSEKLDLLLGSAEPLADLLNGVLDQFIPGRGTPVRETVVFTQEWVDGGTWPDGREYRKPDVEVFIEADKDLTCICKTDSSMDWAAGDPECPVHAEWQNPTFPEVKNNG